jgi:hypothetical protein
MPFTAERGNRPAREWPTNRSSSTMTSKSRFRRIGLVTDWRHVARTVDRKGPQWHCLVLEHCRSRKGAIRFGELIGDDEDPIVGLMVRSHVPASGS